jgi:hypothetical protein
MRRAHVTTGMLNKRVLYWQMLVIIYYGYCFVSYYFHVLIGIVSPCSLRPRGPAGGDEDQRGAARTEDPHGPATDGKVVPMAQLQTIKLQHLRFPPCYGNRDDHDC